MSAEPALPQVVSELSAVAGPEAAWALVRAWGGRHVYIPPTVSADHWLAQLVGLAAAEAICRHYRDSTAEAGHIGRRLLIPKAGGQSRSDEAWAKALAAELSLREIAGMMGVTERAVSYRKAKAERADDRQGKLFE
jgi:hypothetical protein